MDDVVSRVDDFTSALQALRLEFVGQVGGTLDEMDGMVHGAAVPVPANLLLALRERLHKLAGSGGTFGFHALSTQARELELAVQQWLEGGRPVEGGDWLRWLDGVAGLRQLVELSSIEDATGATGSRQPLLHDPRAPVRLLLVHPDPGFRESMSIGLQQFGYAMAQCQDLASAGPLLPSWRPDILLVSHLGEEGRPEELIADIRRLQSVVAPRVQVIVLAERSDFDTRLAAAKAGAELFLPLPVDAPTVAGTVEQLLREREQSPLSVLIVDDDELLAERYRLVLAGAGLQARWVSRPEEVMGELNRLHPDVLLMDLRMPGYAGDELARAIRYDRQWQSLPIVYLSAETDTEKQHRAMASGADDFLVKPISDMQLVAAVRARGQRARKLEQLMSQDSLTGLLKHASIKDRLSQEMERAKRQGTPLAVAMVDIDWFKRINDSWGHPMGDQVIKTLSQLLRQRLRRMDSIGRYGGEEFLAILPACTTDDALRSLDDIRKRFGAVNFSCQGQAFQVTISAGLAGSEQYDNSQQLLAAADAALYRAKHDGRNRVCRAAGREDAQ